jgi:hypothetical protein
MGMITKMCKERITRRIERFASLSQNCLIFLIIFVESKINLSGEASSDFSSLDPNIKQPVSKRKYH